MPVSNLVITCNASTAANIFTRSYTVTAQQYRNASCFTTYLAGIGRPANTTNAENLISVMSKFTGTVVDLENDFVD
jgi:hypothetical protein